MNIIYCDVKFGEEWKPLIKKMSRPKIYIDRGYKLPFKDNSLDAVISCGVLEHVPDIEKSLSEIKRIIKPDGHFIIHHFPNTYSYIEYLSSKIGREVHDLKLTKNKLEKLLENYNFKVVQSEYKYLLPRNIAGMKKIRYLSNLLSDSLFKIDNLLSSVPLLNMLSTTISSISINKKEQL